MSRALVGQRLAGQALDALEQAVERRQALFRGGDDVVAEIDRRAVVGAEQQIADQIRAVAAR